MKIRTHHYTTPHMSIPTRALRAGRLGASQAMLRLESKRHNLKTLVGQVDGQVKKAQVSMGKITSHLTRLCSGENAMSDYYPIDQAPVVMEHLMGPNRKYSCRVAGGDTYELTLAQVLSLVSTRFAFDDDKKEDRFMARVQRTYASIKAADAALEVARTLLGKRLPPEAHVEAALRSVEKALAALAKIKKEFPAEMTL